jgi:hypothetical protein
MNLDFGKLIKNVSSVKLGKGIFGKTATVLIVLIMTFGFIAWASQNVWVCAGTLLLITFIVTFILFKLIRLAEKTPQTVILEGAEFILHQQIEIASKGMPTLPISHGQYIIGTPLNLSPADQTTLDNPDVPPTQQTIDNQQGKEDDNANS